MLKFLIILVLTAGACSFKKNQLENQTLKGHEELYSMPSSPKLKSLDDHIKRVVIAATNDVEGQYQTTNFEFQDEFQHSNKSIQVGGEKIIESYFSILRKKYEHVVLVDSGNIFPHNHNELKTVQDFYANLKYDALTIGLKDFSIKLPNHLKSSISLLQEFAKSSPTPLLLSNLVELKTARAIEWPGTKNYLLKDFGGVKVGIIGLVPDDLVTLTPINNRVGFFVDRMLESTLRYSRLLRSMGADMVIVLTNQGLDCGNNLAQEGKLPLSKVNFEPMRPDVCDLTSPLGSFLKRLPHDLIDAVISGRNAQKTVNFVNGVLVMSAFNKGSHFSFAEFLVDTKLKKIIPEETIAHQPIMFCHEFFEKTHDCYTEDSSINHEKREPAFFLGDEIKLNKDNNELNEQKVSQAPIDIKKILTIFNSDITYKTNEINNSQLIQIEITGNELSKILEEDFNLDEAKKWLPNPFVAKEDQLIIQIHDRPLEALKTYRLLSDIESFQHHRFLRKFIQTVDSKQLVHFSWNDLPGSQDEVNFILSAPEI